MAAVNSSGLGPRDGSASVRNPLCPRRCAVRV